jgi:CheY-like chemotaxis protein
MVRGHKGTIKVRSAPGQGCGVRILFPTFMATREPEPAPAVGEPAVTNNRPRPTILLVDDEEPVRVVCRRVLEHLGCEVLLATDGPSALEVYRRHLDKIDGVLLDLTMPRLNGDQVFLKLREIKPDIKVILYSGYNEEEASQRFAALGFNGFLQKPFSLSALKEKVKSIVPAV